MSRAAALLSVNVGRPSPVDWAASLGSTAIAKSAVSGPVLATRDGLAGDDVADRRHHGGPDRAVYAVAREDLDRWGTLLGRELPSGLFGENLTTVGIDVNEAEIGERWRVGRSLLEVAGVRIPCQTFAGWMRSSGYDARGWVRRFTAEGRPGPYLRVLEEGLVAAGDPIEVVHRPGHGVTVTAMFRGRTTERGLMPQLEQALNGPGREVASAPSSAHAEGE